eukprot:g32002.t1
MREEQIKREEAKWITYFKRVTEALFPKKQSPAEEDYQVIVDILTALIQRAPEYGVAFVTEELLGGKGAYTPAQKALGLKCLGHLARDLDKGSPELKNVVTTLAAVITPYILNPEAIPPVIVQAALSCFPALRATQQDELYRTAYAVGLLTVDSDRETAHEAVLSLQRFVLLKALEESFHTSHYTRPSRSELAENERV